MDIKSKSNLKRKFANFFGAVGYLVCSLQWLWVVVLYFSWIKLLVVFISPNGDNHVTKAVTPVATQPNIALAIVSGIIVVAMLALTLYFIYKIPATIIKTSKKTVQEAARTVAPVVLKVQHKKDTKKNLIQLTPKITVILKMVLTLIPLILTFFSQFIEKQMISYQIATLVGFWLAGACVLSFTFQYLLAKLLVVKSFEIW